MSGKSTVPSVDEVWKIVRETQKNLKDLSTGQKELQAGQKELQAGQKELQASQKKTDLQIQKVGGRFNERWGHLVESLVKGKLIQLLRGRGIKVKRLFSNVVAEREKGNGSIQNTEFDIVAVNGDEVVVVEVKTVLTLKSLHRFLAALRNFKAYFPEYEDRALYGAVAYLKSEGGAHVLSEEEGLFVIRAVGDGASLINKPDFKPKAFV